jgi:hypothetical protein
MNAMSNTVGKLSVDLGGLSDFSNSHDLLGESVEALLVSVVENTTVISQSNELINDTHNHLLVALGVVGLTVSSTFAGGLLTIGAVDSLLGELGRVVSVKLVKRLLLLFVKDFQVGVHLVVVLVGGAVYAVLAGNHASLGVVDLEVLVTILVVAIPEGSVVKVRLNAVHGAKEVQIVILVGLVARQDECREVKSVFVDLQSTSRRSWWDQQLESSQGQGL